MADADPAATTAAVARLARIGRLIRYIQSDQPDLTNRQMAVMMIVGWTSGPHRVRTLAGHLGVLKPVITRVLNTLSALGFVRRIRNEDDRRDLVVEMTAKGREFLERLEGMARG